MGTDGPAQAGAERAYDIADICAQLPEIDDVLDEAGRAAVERVVGRLRADGDAATAHAGLTEILRTAGVAGGLSRGLWSRPLGGGAELGRERPVEEYFACPGQLCARVQLPEDGSSPQCAVFDSPLARRRL